MTNKLICAVLFSIVSFVNAGNNEAIIKIPVAAHAITLKDLREDFNIFNNLLSVNPTSQIKMVING